MKVVLVFPPFADASQPGAALPSLAAALRSAGIETEMLDLNLEAWEWILDPSRQLGWLAQAEQTLREFDHQTRLDSDDRSRYLALAEGCVRGAAAQPQLQRALSTLRGPDFYSTTLYQIAVKTLEAALSLASAIHHPSRLGWGRYWPAASLSSSAQMVKEARNRRSNPFLPLVQKEFACRIRESKPDIVGISITYQDQIVPALSVAAECRRLLPDATVVLGGQIVSHWGADLLGAVALRPLADAFVLGDGESALREITRARQDGRDLSGVPNVLLPGAAMLPDIRRENVDELDSPDYRGLPLERYLSPHPVLTLAASRGCYWRRCTFCAVSPAFRGSVRARSPDRVRKDFRLLWERHGARHFTFGDDALPPRVVTALATEGTSLPVQIHWQAELRWDAIASLECLPGLNRAGATNLVFGLESGSPRVLALMKKGTQLDRALAIVEHCTQQGIGVNLQLFLGFPGERPEDVAGTMGFLERARAETVTVSCGLFEVQKGSAVWNDPRAFGILLESRGAEQDLRLRFQHQPRKARTRERTWQIVQRRFASRVPYLRCGIDAHALLWLSEPDRFVPAVSQIPSPADPLALASGAVHRSFSWDLGSLRTNRPRRHASRLAFSLEHGRVVSIGPVATVLLRACDGKTTIGELLRHVDTNARRRIRRTLDRLARHGIIRRDELSPLPPTPNRSTALAGTHAGS